jgi:RHS repeat-associated protein
MERRTGAARNRQTKLLKIGATTSAFFFPIILAAAYLNMGQTCSCGSTCPPAVPDFRVSKSTGGVAADDASTDGAVAAQGNDIAFSSEADNLDPAAASVLGPHVFVHNISTKATNWVSLAALGEPNAIGSGSPALSEYGQFIAFEQQFFSIPPTHAIIFRDLDAVTPDFETIASTGTTPASDPTMSGDGRFVAFATEAALLPEDTDAASDIYLKDLLSDTLILRSDDAGAVDAVRPKLSRDGQWITYDLEGGFPGLIVVDVERIQGLAALTGDLPSLSDDGSMVAFRRNYRIFVEPPLGIDPSQEVSVDASGIPATDDCDNPVISGNGRYVAFSCIEAMTDHGALNQVYVRDLIEQTTKLASITDTGVPANSMDSKPVGMSANGNAVTIESSADNLGDVPGGFSQLFRIPISYWDEGNSTCSADDTTCDGNDDDCDGQTDEDFVPQATSCGMGPCTNTGTTTCDNGVQGDNCTPLAGAPDANCDGIDDDCDGTPDDDYPPQLVTCGVGVCQGTDMTSCIGAQVVHNCTPSPENAAPSDNTCDGIDNNCDGQTDEGYVSSVSTCFVGGCQRTGLYTCAAGSVVDTCPTAACNQETACGDAVDNDNDGLADCADTDCAAVPTCTTPPSLTLVPDAAIALGTVHTIQLQATDLEGDPLLYSVQPSDVANVTLDAQSGLFTFSPDFTQTGAFAFAFSVTDGTHVVSDTATLTVSTPNPSDPTGLTGLVADAVDADAGQTVPIANVTVRDLESGTSTTTDALGEFTLTGLTAGLHHIEYDGSTAGVRPDGLEYASYRAPVTVQLNVVDYLERPVYLPRFDPLLAAEVFPGVPTELSNPTIGVSMTIPAGKVHDADGEYEGTISVSEVPASFTPGSLPDTLDPALVVTIQPMGLTFTDPVPIEFPNPSNLPEGSEVDIWSLDHSTGEFFPAGTGQVQNGVIVTIDGGVREASWHFPLPPGPDDDDQPDEENDCGGSAGGFSSRLSHRTGCLQSLISLPTYRSQDQDRGVQLVYKTSRAHPYPALTANSVILKRSAVPDFISYEATIGGMTFGAPSVFHTAGILESEPTPVRGGAGFAAAGLQTGTYDAQVGVRYIFGAATFGGRATVGDTFDRPLSIVNGIDSPIGAGWSVVGLDRLHQMNDGRILLESGAGSHLVYRPDSGVLPVFPVFGKMHTYRAIKPMDISNCDPSKPCDGLDPAELAVSSVPGAIMQITDVTGTTNGGGICPPSGAEGTSCGSISSVNYASANNISGYRDDGVNGGRIQGLMGVFLSNTAKTDPLPPRLNTTFSDSVSDFYPELNQTFFVGDGRDENGQLQSFHPPAGATRVVFGFINGNGNLDAEGNVRPGWMSDNSGFLDVEVSFLHPSEGTTNYVGSAYDRTHLERLSDNTYQRQLTDGTVVSFNAEGLMTQAVDRFGNTMTYLYDAQDRLERIIDPVDRETVFAYAGERLSTITDPYARPTSFQHDALGNLTQVTHPDLTEQNFIYDPRRLMTAEQDQRGFWTTREYDFTGRVVSTELPGGAERLNEAAQARGLVDQASGQGTEQNPAPILVPSGDVTSVVTDAESRATTYVFNARGQRTSETIADLTTTYEYDADFRLRRTVRPDGSAVRRPYDEATNSVTVTDEALEAAHDSLAAQTFDRDTLDRLQAVTTFRGTTSFSYDDVLNTESLMTPAGRAEFRQLNAQGLLCARTDRFGAHWRYDYDARGNLSAIVQGVASPTCTAAALPKARTTLLDFTADGTTVTTTDALMRVFVERLDAMNRPTELEGPSHDVGSVIVGLGFDEEGRNESVEPPGQPAHTFQYNLRGSLASYTPPDVVGISDPRTTYGYNGEQQQATVTDAEGRFVTTSYNPRADIDGVTTMRGPYVYGYDPGAVPTGQLHTITTPEGDTLEWLYSSAYGGALHTGYSWSGAVTGSLTWTYTPDGLLDTERVNAVLPATYGYDNDQLVTAAGAMTMTRDSAHGLVTSTTLPDLPGGVETRTTMTYSAFGELSEQTASWDATEFYRASYEGFDGSNDLGERDALGRIVREVETVEGVQTTYEYRYTPGGALDEVKTNGVVTEAYTYDDNGNRLTALGVPGTAVYDPQDRLMEYGGVNGLAFSYTDHGDLRQKLDQGTSAMTTYEYDVFGNLRQAVLPGGTTIDYVIDALDRRIGKRVDGVLVKGFLWQNGLRVAAELNGSGAIISRFIYGERPNVPEYMEHDPDGDGTIDATYRLVHDHLGSVRLVVDVDTSAVVQRIDYDSFGRVMADSNPGFQPFGFAGGLYDPDTKLVRFGAREYDAEVGRWTNKDPIWFGGGDTELYGYAFGDPVNVFDPDGKLAGGLAPVAVALALLYAYVYTRTHRPDTNPETNGFDDPFRDPDQQDASGDPTCGRPPPNLSRCLDACHQGSHGREEFCRSMIEHGYSPEERKRCWSATRDSLRNCESMCKSIFGD